MDKVFCIYECKEIDFAESNPEHIIPLSLGGSNMLTIRVSKDKNSQLGTAVDGELVNDPLISLLRMKMGYTGHSRKKIHPVFKRAFIKKSGKPVQARYTPGKLKVFSPIDKRDLRDDELTGEIVRANITYNKMIRIVFTAKVALAAGYFIYGDVFVKYADHDSLRILMNYQKGEPLERFGELPLGVECNLSSMTEEDEKKIISMALGTSGVQFKLYPDNWIRTTVAIGGEFLGAVTYRADTSQFPNSGEYEDGHIISIQSNGLLSMSYREMLNMLDEGIKSNKARL